MEKKYTLAQALKDTYKFTAGYRRSLLTFFVLTVFTSGVAMVPPYLYGQILGRFNGGDFEDIYLFIFLTAISLITVTVIKNVISYKTKILAEYIRNNTRIISLRHLYKLDYEFFETNATGVYLSRISNGSNAVRRMIKRLFTGIFQMILELLFAIALIFSLKLEIGVYALLVTTFFFWVIYRNNKKYQKLNIDVAKESESTYDKVLEFSTKIGIVKFLNVREKLLNILKDSYQGVIEKSKVLRKFERITAGYQSLILDLSGVLLLGYLAFLAIEGLEEVAVVVALYAYFEKITSKVSNLWMEYEDIMTTVTDLQRLSLIFDEEPKIDTHLATRTIDTFNTLDFQNVGYQYTKSSKQAIKDFSFTFVSGKQYGIVGLSGSGKSTLAKLVIKMYLPNSGEILLNEQNIKEISFENLVRKIRIVPQENEIIHGSIRENMQLITEKEVSDSEILEALRIADLDIFVEGLDQKMDTIIGSNGIQISGGQKQRLCIARAILDRPDVLLLDEATSHLDVLSEQRIYQNIDELKDLTLISITHRLKVCPSFDNVLVMNQGELVGAGSHLELLESNKHYKNLWERSDEEPE